MGGRSVVPGFRFDARRARAHFEVVVPGTGGRSRRRKTVSAASRDKALSLFREFRKSVLRKRNVGPELFSDYIARFWLLMEMRLGTKTASHERAVVENDLLPFFGSCRLEEINAALVRDFIASLRTRTQAPATINRKVSVLRKILNDAVSREVIAEFPVKARIGREKEVALRLELSPEEKGRFLDAFDDEVRFRQFFWEHRSRGRLVTSPHFGPARSFGGGRRSDGQALGYYFDRFRELKPFFVVALETGLRRGDLLDLRWSSVDLRAGWIRVAVQKTTREAVIPISNACRQALLESRRRELVSERVFVASEGHRLSVTTVNRYFALAKKIAGINRRCRFHDLRHTFGSTLASHGVSLQVIARALGHASVRMSERYARPSEDSLQEIRRALDSAEDESADSF